MGVSAGESVRMGPSAVWRVGGVVAILIGSALLFTCAHGQADHAESRDGLALLTKSKRDTYSSSTSHCSPTHVSLSICLIIVLKEKVLNIGGRQSLKFLFVLKGLFFCV